MKILSCILVLLLLSSCMSAEDMTDGVVEIVGIRDGVEVVRGMGICVSESEILTSAHVVRDDRLSYMVGDVSYTVGERHSEQDVAILIGQDNPLCVSYREVIHNRDALTLGQPVSIPVVRDNSYSVLTGSITSLTGNLLAYDALGRTQALTGIVLTDITLLPGDSGAPILDRAGRVVDVVHVQ